MLNMKTTLFLEDVFCDSGVPQYTFVEPSEYTKTKVALRTPGRGVVVEGPSGIGKTTCIKKILEEINLKGTCLSARKKEDREYIKLLLQEPQDDWGIVIIDDFHYLSDEIKQSISDLLKVCADEGRTDMKLVLIGINRAGESLVNLAADLNDRIETIKFQKNSNDKVLELIERGEKALNVSIQCKQDIVQESCGSFHVAQMLCKTICIIQNITERTENLCQITTSIEAAITQKMQELNRVFKEPVQLFAVGNRNRRSGRVPYLRLLMWLAESDEGAIQMSDICLRHPQYKASINQIADRGISLLISKHKKIGDILYYETNSKLLAVEDPKFIFYLKHLDWDQFAKEMGLKLEECKTKYDFAISFAGERRKYAQMIYNQLTENEFSVFYDKDLNISADILGRDLDKYFGPIYEADATYIIALIDNTYSQKIWPAFEMGKYKKRFKEDSVIPILFEDFHPSLVDPLYNKGCMRIDSTKPDIQQQIEEIVKHLTTKMNIN